MKIRIDIAEGNPEEVILRASSHTDEIRHMQKAIEAASGGTAELALFLGDTEYFVPLSDLLFFETDGRKVMAHTKEHMFLSEDTLSALEHRLPRRFVRVSRSCLINSAKVESLNRGVTGTAEARFFGSDKKAYISRMYYKILRDIIYETRLQS